MTDLLSHFKVMQAMAASFASPGPYISRDGGNLDSSSALGKAAFINDMIYMLDGPEQRAAQEEHDADLVVLERANRDLLGRLAVTESDKGRATAKLKEVKDENNDLRSALHTAELAYAKLRGYLDHILDSQPPVMVPQQREPMHAQMPDGTQGTPYGGWQGGSTASYGSKPREWFHRS